MIPIQLRILLVIGSLFTMIFMLYRIRIAQIQIKDSIFWIIFSLLLLTLSIFPEIALFASRMLGILSPMNFVLLLVIFLLLLHAFAQNMRISQMDILIRKLSQHIAVNEKKRNDDE